jgi:hypothetical protein
MRIIIAVLLVSLALFCAADEKLDDLLNDLRFTSQIEGEICRVNFNYLGTEPLENIRLEAVIRDSRSGEILGGFAFPRILPGTQASVAADAYPAHKIERVSILVSVYDGNALLATKPFEIEPSHPPLPSNSAAVWIWSAIAVAGALAALWLYRLPTVNLSLNPANIRNLPIETIPDIKRQLDRFHRLASVLSGAKVAPRWFDAAHAFVTEPEPAARAAVLAERLGAADPQPGEDPQLFNITLGLAFPLNLDHLLLRLSAEVPAADVHTILKETREDVTLVQSDSTEIQAELHKLATDRQSLWLAPQGSELTKLFLSEDPNSVLAHLLSSRLPLVRISPYQLGGGVNKSSIFFGRERLLAHILNREPANYLLVGGRQLGKSSLLKEVARRFEEDPRASVSYVTVMSADPLPALARAAGMTRTPPLDADAIFEELGKNSAERRLILLDEADEFFRVERQQGFPYLARMRGLSEEGRCHFVLAGFWELYEATVLDYQSPLRNFGETLSLAELELHACRELATVPMVAMQIRWTSPDLVDQLIEACGQRANLIALICHEIVKELGDGRELLIQSIHLERALSSDAVYRALEGWRSLTDDPEACHFDRVVILTIAGRDSFTVGELLGWLDEAGFEGSLQSIEKCLARLELAFLLKRQEGPERRYGIPVPLVRDRLLAQEPELLLRREIADWQNARLRSASS